MPPAVHQQELAALQRAAVRYSEWRRDWHDGQVRVDHKHLARLRAAAREFHDAVAVLMVPGISGTRARVLCRMQEAGGFQHFQSECHEELTRAMTLAHWLHEACSRDVRPGVKADALTTAWIWAAADEWQACGLRVSGSERSRFVRALESYAAPGLPAPVSPDAIRQTLKRRQGPHLPGG